MLLWLVFIAPIVALLVMAIVLPAERAPTGSPGDAATPTRAATARIPVPLIVQRVLASDLGPTVLALFLAHVSLPVVALSLDMIWAPAGVSLDDPVHLSPVDPARWVAAAGAVFSAASVAGFFGGLVVRWHAKIGGLFTFALAWEVAIIALPLTPWLLHLDMGFSYLCLDGCSAAIESIQPTSGMQIAVVPWAVQLSPLFAPVSFAALLVGVVVWARLLRRFTASSGAVPA